MRVLEMAVLIWVSSTVACSSSSTAEAADSGGQDAASADGGTDSGCPFAVAFDAGIGACSLGDAGSSDGGAPCALSCDSTFATPVALTPSSTDATCASLTMIDPSSCVLTPSDTCAGTAVCSVPNAIEPSCKVTAVFDFSVTGTQASGHLTTAVLGSDNAYHGCEYDFSVTIGK